MTKHEHDLHSLFFFLVVAFFIFAIVMKVNPGLTTISGNVVQSEGASDSINKFLDIISSREEVKTVSAEALLKPIEIEKKTSVFKKFLNRKVGDARVIVVENGNNKRSIGGLATGQIALETKLSCNWANKDNSNYQVIKGLTGNDACKKAGYSSCLTSNQVITSNYQQGDLQFKIVDNYFDDCSVRVRTISNSYSEGNMDVVETGYTNILCCN